MTRTWVRCMLHWREVDRARPQWRGRDLGSSGEMIDTTMKQTKVDTASILDLARAGRAADAIAAGEAALAAGAADPGLAMFVGTLCGRAGELDRGARHLQFSLQLAPDNVVARIELGRMLLTLARFDEALALVDRGATATTSPGRELLRIRAHALRHLDRNDAARHAYGQLTQADPADFESWDGLGLACLNAGEVIAAIPAFAAAARLQSGSALYRIHLASAYLTAGRPVEAVQAARDAIARDAASIGARIELARAFARLEQAEEALPILDEARQLAGKDVDALLRIAAVESDLRSFGRAEATLRELIAIDPCFTPAWVALGAILERTNRIADLGTLLAEAEAAGIAAPPMALHRARYLRAEERLDEALQAAQHASVADDPVARAQLIGQIADRIGNIDLAFAAFEEANAALAERESAAQEKAEAYLAMLREMQARLTPQWYGSWQPRAAGSRRAPLFIFGFPRSGTTLIDTMLIGHPDTLVMEEEPFLFRVSEQLGSVERLATLGQADVDRMRDFYFGEIERVYGDVGDRLVVDKNPLGLSGTLLMHRLFPDARFLFVERHPFDVVLSCFITSARLNNNVATFSSLEGIARLYDAVMGFWNRCCAIMQIATHRTRYERLIQSPADELRPLADFAGLDWNDRLLRHEENAAGRAYIGSPSYAQVTQPIYTRASGRWRRYRRHFGATANILAPWAERMGYDT